jgi:chorismate mutase
LHLPLRHAPSALQPDSSGTVTLENVRSSLIRQEDTIIFNIIERSQFAHNRAVYTSGGIPVPAYKANGDAFTFLEFLLRDTEAVHGRIRRYTSPDEHAFFPEALPPTVRLHPPGVFGDRNLNVDNPSGKRDQQPIAAVS